MLPKIGIATFTNYNNYGSILQRFALLQALATLGFEGISLYLSTVSLQRQRIWDVLIHSLPRMRKRNRRFEEFRQKQVPLTTYSTYEDLEAAHEEYAGFIAGSDQIWRGRSRFFFLNFARNRPKVAYGASGLNHLPETDWDWAAKALVPFEKISARETGAVAMLKKIARREVEHVVDPTLLWDASFWEKVAVAPRRKKPYLFCYFVQSRRHPLAYMPQASGHYFFDTVRALARRSGLQPVFLCGAPKGYFPYNFSEEAAAGPQEFLGLIQNAEMVITDSYHATLFALQFRKPFFTIPVAWKEASYDESLRHQDFLEWVGLAHRFLPLGSPLPASADIPLDVSDAHANLARERECSWEYLRGAVASMK